MMLIFLLKKKTETLTFPSTESLVSNCGDIQLGRDIRQFGAYPKAPKFAPSSFLRCLLFLGGKMDTPKERFGAWNLDVF